MKPVKSVAIDTEIVIELEGNRYALSIGAAEELNEKLSEAIRRNTDSVESLAIKATVDLVSAETGVSVKKMRGHDRSEKVCDARWIVWHVLSEHYGLSSAKCGRVFDRHHATAIYGLDAVREKMAAHLPFKKRVDEVMSKLPPLF